METACSYGRGKRQRNKRLFLRLCEILSVDNDICCRTTARIQVCHLCDNPCCENPRHSYIGTTSENQWDKTPEARKAPGRASAEKKVGCHNPIYSGVGGRIGGKVIAERNGGFRDPAIGRIARERGFETRRRPVRLTNKETGEVRDFPSQGEAARELGLRQSLVSAVCRGRRGSTGGYSAEYLPKAT